MEAVLHDQDGAAVGAQVDRNDAVFYSAPASLMQFHDFEWLPQLRLSEVPRLWRTVLTLDWLERRFPGHCGYIYRPESGAS